MALCRVRMMVYIGFDVFCVVGTHLTERGCLAKKRETRSQSCDFGRPTVMPACSLFG
jgi:hypothetical protein